MKITDIIRSVLDIIDSNDQSAQPMLAVAVEIDPEQEMQDIQRLAGLPSAELGEFANAPAEVIAPVTAAFPAGDDVHHSKNPADIRTNAPSMFPGYQARM